MKALAMEYHSILNALPLEPINYHYRISSILEIIEELELSSRFMVEVHSIQLFLPVGKFARFAFAGSRFFQVIPPIVSRP